jgi:hypothetical protein
MPRIGSTLLAGLAYAALVAWSSWPLAAHLASALPAPTPPGLAVLSRIDVDLVVWILAWGAHALVHQPLELFQANIFHPAPDVLAASENLLGLQPIAAPVFWLTGNPVLTYNVTLLAMVWLGAQCSFTAVRAWTGNAAAGFLAGTAFALAPAVVADWVRLHWTAVALFPLIAQLLWRCARRPSAASLAALAVATALQLAAGVYVGFELVVWLLALGPAVALGARRRGGRVLPAIAAVAAGALLVSPLALPYLRVLRLGRFPDLAVSLRTVAATSPEPAELLAAIPQELSWPVIALATLAVFGRRRPGRDLRLGLAAAGALGFVLACGTSLPGLYRALMEVAPGFATVRGPARFMILTPIAGALLGGIGSADLAARFRARGARLGRFTRPAIVALAVALALGRAPAEPGSLAAVPAPGAWDAYRWLAEHGEGGPLLELPVHRSPLDPGPLLATGGYMVGSTLHWLPLLNGYSGHPPPSAHLVAALAERLPDPGAFSDLCALVGVRWIAVHRDAMTDRGAAWDAGVPQLPLRVAARFPAATIYEVTASCGGEEAHLLAELRGERRGRTLGDVPLDPLPATALRGRVEAAIEPRMTSGLRHVLDVVVTNESSVAWPASTSQAAGRVAVQTRWRIAGESEPKYEGSPVPLARDLAPGETVRLKVEALTRRPGAQQIEIGLVQEGRGWFDDLGGAASLRKAVQAVPYRRPGSGAG